MFFPFRMNIGAGDLVLEIGPGGYPYWRSDVLVDRFLGDETDLQQYGGTQQSLRGKFLILADSARLPFADGTFDYVICSHVLEHIPISDLESVIDELTRVAKRGYIEFPSIFYEYIYNFEVHITLLNLVENRIIAFPKSEWQLGARSKIQEIFYNSRRVPEQRNFERDIPELIALGSEWCYSNRPILHRCTTINEFLESISVDYYSDLFNKKRQSILERLEKLEKTQKPKIWATLKNVLRAVPGAYRAKTAAWQLLGLNRPKVEFEARIQSVADLGSQLVCPFCRKAVRLMSTIAECPNCQKRYSLRPYPDFRNPLQ